MGGFPQVWLCCGGAGILLAMTSASPSATPHLQAVTDQAAIEAVARLADMVWREHYTPIIGRAQVDYMLARFQSPAAIARQIGQGDRYFLLNQGGQGVGYMGLRPEDGAIQISKFYVARPARGRGLARLMLGHIERMAREDGQDRLWLTVNKHNRGSIAAYERLGFSRTADLVQDIGNGFVMDDYRMEKQLSLDGGGPA